MKLIRPTRSALWKRTSTMALTLVLIIAAFANSGCAVKMIGDYDETIDKGVSDVQQRAETYFSKLKSDPNTSFDQSVYDDIHVRMTVLQTRAAALEKYRLIAQELTNMQAQFDKLQQLDKSMKRPFPADTLASAESAITVSVESILKLELALKRGAAPSAKSKP